MENINNDMEQPFWEVMTNRVERQEQKIVDLEKKVSAIPDYWQAVSVAIQEIQEVKRILSRMYFPEKEMRDLNTNLHTTNGYLRQPVINKTEHHHHVPKIIIISAILLVAICILIPGWVITYRELEQYKENDTKYRFLKIQNNGPLRNLLSKTDSLYNVHPNLRSNVIQQEDSILNRLKRIREIESKEKEVKDLKLKLK